MTITPICLDTCETVRLMEWRHEYCTLSTLHDFRTKYGGKPTDETPELWAIFAGTALSSNPDFYHREKSKWATSIVIHDGQVIRCQGNQYRVEVLKGCESFPRYCDPIKFHLISPA